MKSDTATDANIAALLADPLHADNPLREPLERMHALYHQQLRQMERITRISDRYQSGAQRENSTLTERLNKQLKQAEKIARISDRYQSMLHDLNLRLERESTHDALTGLANRRRALSRMQELVAAGHALCIALVDVDLFKRINDALGHEAGDRALVAVGLALRDPVGATDLVARWGGEEFLLLWSDVPLAQVADFAHALRSGVPAASPQLGGQLLQLTASFGLAERRPDEDLNELLRRADAALYAAKAAGRDSVQVAA